jgi:hypothetical protein
MVFVVEKKKNWFSGRKDPVAWRAALFYDYALNPEDNTNNTRVNNKGFFPLNPTRKESGFRPLQNERHNDHGGPVVRMS